MIRLIANDFKSNKLITASTCVFMTITAMLLGLAIFLFASLWTSIDSLMKKAETPHFLQMHTGELEEAEIEAFAAARDDVEEGQIGRFLNLQNSQLSIGGKSFETNMQDNGLCYQSECFDYLLDADGNAGLLPRPFARRHRARHNGVVLSRRCQPPHVPLRRLRA